MDIFLLLFSALRELNYEILLFLTPTQITSLYLILFAIVFLENGVLPTAFLPGDSLLLIVGILTSQGILNLPFIIVLLTVAASLGSWLSYSQGKLLEHFPFIRKCMLMIPERYHKNTQHLFEKHGFAAFFIGRFIAFIRTLLPMLAGYTQVNNRKFQLFNWLSALLWITLLVCLGYGLGHTDFFDKYKKEILALLFLAFMALLLLGLFGSLFVLWRRRKTK